MEIPYIQIHFGIDGMHGDHILANTILLLAIEYHFRHLVSIRIQWDAVLFTKFKERQ